MRTFAQPLTFVLGVALVGLRTSLAAGSKSHARRLELVSAKDRQTAVKAMDTSVKYCKGLPELEVPENAKQDLMDASGDNWVLQQMKGAKNNEEFQKNMENNIDVGFVIKKGGPIVASIVFFFSYCICCWSAWPFKMCCRCCRCCTKEKKVNPMFKLVGFIVLAGIVLGLLISAAMSRAGFNQAVDGFKHTSCTGSKLLNSTLSGQADPPFLGFIPTLDTFQELIDSLDSTSTFITDLEAVLTDTKAIEESVALASGTMTLLKDMMASNANKKPKTSAGVDLLHECTLCPQLEAVLTPAIQSLNDGVAVKLKDARGEVKKQLTGPALTDLQTTVKEATAPLGEFNDLMINSFSFIVDSNDIQDITDLMERFGLLGTMVLVLLGLLISCCACTGMGLWTFREAKKIEDKVEEVVVGETCEKPQLAKRPSKLEEGLSRAVSFSKKHRAHVHRCSLCTWCCGCYYVLFAFLFGGILTAISVPLASVCLIMDDMSSTLIDEIGGVLSVNFTGDSGDIMSDMIDKCFRNPDKSANPLLLNIIFTRNATNHKITLRETIVNNTKDTINAQFDGVTQSLNTSSMSLNSDPNIVTLKNTLRDTRMDAMMVPSTSYDFAGSSYSEMVLDTRSGTKLPVFWASSAACNDFTVPADMGALSGQSVKGISSFSTNLQALGTAVSHSTCADKVTCSDGSGTPAGKACRAANLFMDLKQDLRTINTLKCRKFFKSGAMCDVINMVESPVGSGSYTNDCLKSDGTLEAKEYDCTLAEFTTLIQGFETRLDKVFQRMDGAAAVTKTKINDDMKGLVDANVIGKIEKVADGLTCGFLGKLYQQFIDATCYSGVWGFTQISNSYVACAALTLILVIMMYVVWRISVDNYNATRNAQVMPK